MARPDLRVLIVAFDGLRPDMVGPDLTPNLMRLERAGTRMLRSRATFPSETRVNQSALVTGCQPDRHGIVANIFMDRALRPGRIFNTARFEDLVELMAARGGGLLRAPSLGEILHDAGTSLAVLGAGTAGGNVLLNHRAEANGTINVSLHGREKSTTPRHLEALEQRIGPVPAAAIPASRQIDWLTEAYTRVVAPEHDPTVSILWFPDPDTTYHYRGLGSPEARQAIRAADAALGRLLDWRADSGRQDGLQIIALSDHGHVTTRGEPLDVAARLRRAGFAVAAEAGDDGVRVVPGLCGGLYTRSEAETRQIADWLLGEPWCGAMLCRDPPAGALNREAARLDHACAADIVTVAAAGLDASSSGLDGWSLHDNPAIPIGCGLHGGLTRFELASYLCLSGSRFRRGARSPAAAGIVDVLPTVLELLEIAPPAPLDGRVLHEALADSDPGPPDPSDRFVIAEARGGRLFGLRHRTGWYLDGLEPESHPG